MTQREFAVYRNLCKAALCYAIKELDYSVFAPDSIERTEFLCSIAEISIDNLKKSFEKYKKQFRSKKGDVQEKDLEVLEILKLRKLSHAEIIDIYGNDSAPTNFWKRCHYKCIPLEKKVENGITYYYLEDFYDYYEN